MKEINNIELKERILLQLANSLVDLNIYGVKDQYPISSTFIFPSLFKFREDIFNAIIKNIDSYHEIMLSQVLQLLSFRGLMVTPEIYNFVLDKLIEKRKDVTLKESLDLTYPKKMELNEITSFNSVKKYILWAEINIDIEYPIFRGFGFNVYTINDLFYKEYNLPTSKFIYSCYMNDKPVYLITGHNRKPGFLTNHRFYGILPLQPIYPKFNDDKDKIKYAVDKILLHLGVNKKIDLEDIVLGIKEKEGIQEDISDEDKEKYIQETYNVLKKMCGIE